MVGVPFRAQGRDPRYGLDCVGLVWAAYAAVGCALPAPTDYPLRGWRRGRIVAEQGKVDGVDQAFRGHQELQAPVDALGEADHPEDKGQVAHELGR